MTWKLLPDKRPKLFATASVFTKEDIKDVMESSLSWKELNTNSFRYFYSALQDEWILERIGSVVLDANVNNYQFKLHGLANLFLVEIDYRGFMESSSDYAFSERETNKLSFHIPLNDDFFGGQFSVYTGPEQSVIQPVVGEMTLWPSFLYSKQEPTSSGVKRMILGTVTGTPFV